MLLAVERGLVGNHVAATKERSLYCAGAAAKRHEDLPADFVLNHDQPRWTWLPLTAKLADSFGWSSYYQAPEVAAERLTPGTVDVGLAKGVSAIEPGTPVEHVGPEHGYKARLLDGVELRLRYIKVNDVLHTHYRISGRWALPSAHDALVTGVRRVVQFFQSKPHHLIPFEPSARELLLGAQLEQSLLASASRGEEGAGEAQHGAAAGQIGVWAALVRILHLVADDALQDSELRITAEDVELSMRVVQISLHIKALARSLDSADLASTQLAAEMPAPAHRPARGDYDPGRFAQAFLSQPSAPRAAPSQPSAAGVGLAFRSQSSQRGLPAEAAVGNGAVGVGEENEDFLENDDAADAAVGEGVPVAVSARVGDLPGGLAVAPPVVPLEISDLKPEAAFFAEGLGPDGSMLLSPGTDGRLLCSDRQFLRQLILTGQAGSTAAKIRDSMRFHGAASVGVKKAGPRVCFPISEVRELLTALATQYSRICTFADDALTFRDFPEGETAQIKLHNEFMLSARLSVHDVSKARISFLRKRPAPASVDGAPPGARRRQAQEEVGGAQAVGRDAAGGEQ